MARLEIGPYDGPGPHTLQAKVTLSRRNILALLHKLDMQGSHRRLENTMVFIESEYSDNLMLVLCCEEDDEHYDDDRRLANQGIPGRMHPETETFIREEVHE